MKRHKRKKVKTEKTRTKERQETRTKERLKRERKTEETRMTENNDWENKNDRKTEKTRTTERQRRQEQHTAIETVAHNFWQSFHCDWVLSRTQCDYVLSDCVLSGFSVTLFSVVSVWLCSQWFQCDRVLSRTEPRRQRSWCGTVRRTRPRSIRWPSAPTPCPPPPVAGRGSCCGCPRRVRSGCSGSRRPCGPPSGRCAPDPPPGAGSRVPPWRSSRKTRTHLWREKGQVYTSLDVLLLLLFIGFI